MRRNELKSRAEQDGAGAEELLSQRAIGDHTQQTKQLYGREATLASNSHAKLYREKLSGFDSYAHCRVWARAKKRSWSVLFEFGGGGAIVWYQLLSSSEKRGQLRGRDVGQKAKMTMKLRDGAGARQRAGGRNDEG